MFLKFPTGSMRGGPESLDGLLETGSVVTVLRSLMGSKEDGSVTWDGF